MSIFQPHWPSRGVLPASMLRYHNATQAVIFMDSRPEAVAAVETSPPEAAILEG